MNEHASLDEIDALIEAVKQQISFASQQLVKDQPVNLAQLELDEQVANLCAAIAQFPDSEAAAIQPRLERVQQMLTGLQTSLIAKRDEIGQQIQGSNQNQQAHRAYAQHTIPDDKKD